MPTINDVARAAGVSTATVSHVINNTRHVTDQTRARVQAAIDTLNYLPHGSARSLRTNSTSTIGLMISDISNPFFPDVVRGVADIAQGHNYTVILCNTDEDKNIERTYLEMLLRKRVDGLIMCPTGGNFAYIKRLVETGTRIVFVDRWKAGLGVDAAVVNNEAAATDAVNYLLGLGHRRIGVLVVQAESTAIDERVKGYRRSLAAAGVPLHDEYIVPCRSSIEAGYQAGLRLLSMQPRPTAVFGTNNLVTLGVIQALASLGLTCPHDISVLGFDDFPWSAAFTPRLTTVAQPSHALGQAAAELLFRRIAHEGPARAVKKVLATEFMIRESCAHPAQPNGTLPAGGAASPAATPSTHG